jgi:hypothetical protein
MRAVTSLLVGQTDEGRTGQFSADRRACSSRGLSPPGVSAERAPSARCGSISGSASPASGSRP